MGHGATRRAARRLADVLRLFLGSNGLGALSGFLGPAAGRSLVFVTTACNPIDDPWFMWRDLEHVRSLGFAVREVDFASEAPGDVDAALDAADVLFLEGGSSYYLLERCQRTGFFERVRRFVETRPFVGMSAGAIVLAPSIEPWSPLTDRSLGKPSTLEGAGLVSFVVMPHYEDQPEYVEAAAKYGARYELLPLRDDEAVIVEGASVRVVASS